LITASENEPAPSHASRHDLVHSALSVSVAATAAALLEGALQPGGVAFAPSAIAGSVGIVLGFVLGTLRAFGSRLSAGARTAAWCAAGAVLGLWPALAVGAAAKLHGAHRTMAVVSLAAGIAGGASAGGYLSLALPSRGGPDRRRHHWLVLATVVCALAAIVALELADDTVLFLRSYPPIRVALFVLASLLVAHAGLALGGLAGRVYTDKIHGRIFSGIWLLALLAGLIASARVSDERASLLVSRPIAGRLLEMARAATDFDRDGASRWFGGGDCAPFDARVSPRAPEIPGNGVDDNCRFGDARARDMGTGDVPVPSGPSPVDVIVVTIDSLRADHLGSYGYRRATSPRLDAFAAGARRFTRAYTSGGWTCLAVPSMLSGLYPRRFDWEAVAITSKDRILPFPWEGTLDSDETWLTNLSWPVSIPGATIPRWLKRRGMRTAAVLTSKPAAIFQYRNFLSEQFDRVAASPNGDDAQAIDAAIELLRSFGDAPFFMWIHLYDPHDPYAPHPGVPVFGDALEDVYDHDIAFTDRELGRLIAATDARRDRPVGLVVTADHGESFVGGVPAHGVDLHDEAIRIPLFVRGPGVSPGVSDAPASLVDLAPTVFEWTETPPPSRLDGSSLVRPDPLRMAITDVWRHDRSGHVYIDIAGATGAEQRLVLDRLSNASTVYAVGDVTQPPRLLDERPEPRLVDFLGHYQEEMGALER
jgi:hypothetical protein